MVSVCTWYPLKSERNISQTQTLHLQYLYALNFHLMKVLYLRLFNERVDKASNIKKIKSDRVGNWTTDFSVKGKYPNH